MARGEIVQKGGPAGAEPGGYWDGVCEEEEEKIQRSLTTRLCKNKNNRNEPIPVQKPR